jgi:hypothetical protein
MHIPRFIAALLAAVSLAAFAQAPEAPKPAPAPSPPARIADVAWLTGYWIGEGMGGVVEDTWMPPRNGVILGAFRLVKNDGTPGFYELFAVEEHEASLRFVVKHFHPDWRGWEEKDKYLALRLTELAPNKAIFGGIGFERTDPETLQVSVLIRRRDGTQDLQKLVFKKKPL